MLYVMVQMWLWLTLAALLGFVVGWIIRGRMLTSRFSDVEDDVLMIQAARDRAEQDNKRLTARVMALEAAASRPAAPAAGADASEILFPPEDDDETLTVGVRPPALKAPRGGEADNLKQIHGIGSKLEDVLHQLGIYHFDQIAHWKQEHVAWVDDYLRFRGRIEREEWIKQARVLSARAASGDETH
jgi:predicted flap endonuclease-1-like 5' DNA nuclease